MVMEEVLLVDDSKKMKASHTHKPRAWRWLNMKPLASKSLVKVLGKEENFCFHPYSYTPRGISKPTLYGEPNQEIKLRPRVACSGRILYLLAIVPLILLP